MSIRSGTKVFILCCLAVILTFFSSATLADNTPSNRTSNDDYDTGWLADGTPSVWDNYRIITMNGDYSYGMWAVGDGNSVNNRPQALSSRGIILINGDYSFGMYAQEGATASNYAYSFLFYNRGIVTDGFQSHGMVAEGSGSQVWNYGDIITLGDSSYGMWATDGAQAYNIGINVLGFSVAGSIETEGEGSHGMVAEGLGSIAANVGSIETSGMNALGMKASGLALALNVGSIETSNTGSTGMGAENIALALNLGQIETEGEAAHGMQANNLGIAVNMKGLPENLLDNLDIIPLPSQLLDILDAFGFFPGSIVTTGYGAHGMYAKDFSVAVNLGDIFIRGYMPEAYGMLAENFSLALNMGNIEIGENWSYESGGLSHGMGARNWSAAINAGSITTYSWYSAYGMLAEDNSIVVNAGSLLSLGGDFLSGLIPGGSEDPEGDDLFSGIIDFVAGIFGGGSSTIETFGYGSHGMVARNWSAAINLDEIVTHGSGAYGMMAENFSLAANLSSDSIETFGDWSHGMMASSNSVALNTGSVLTHGDYSAGMWAYDFSIAVNTGYIETGAALPEENGEEFNGELFALQQPVNGSTGGYGSHGMVAKNFSAALNFGDIVTNGSYAYGMWAYDNSIAVNDGYILTSGEASIGMVAGNLFPPENGNNHQQPYGGEIDLFAFDPGNGFNDEYEESGFSLGSMIVNTGTIETHGSGSYGMYASGFSAALNLGDIITHGRSSSGMFAFENSLIANIDTETIETWGDYSHGMEAYTYSMALNTGTIITHGNNSKGMLAADHSLLVNTGSIETGGIQAHGMEALINSTAINTGSILTSGFESRGISAQDSIVINTGSIETEGTLSDGIFGVNAAILNTGSVKTSGATSSGILLWEGSVVNTGTVETSGSNSEALYAGKALAVNTGTLKTTGANSAAAHIDENSLFINTGVLDSENGNAVTADGNSIVVLLDGTVLAGSHTLEDVDGDSDLAVLMDDDLAAQVVNFGSLTKAGGGTLLVEGGSSVVGKTLNAQGTLAVEGGTQFTTGSYDQLSWGSLYLYANPDSVTDLDAVPLWVYDHASISGSVYIDMSMATQPGLYRYIRAETYDWDFDTYFVNNPYFIPYDPQWITGGSFLYTSFLGYSFSQAALGMVAAIDDWSLLRHIMANHLQDVASSMKDMEVGEKKVHAHVLAGKTSRDPATPASAGFDSTQKGISVGFDKKQNETTAWGMYLGYTEKDIDFTGPSMVFADWENQDTWHLGGYISKRWDNWILSNTLTYRKSDHKTFRAQVGGDARASFDSWAITNDLRLGYMAKEIGPDSNWQVIPEVGLNVGYINRGGYTETNGFTYGDYSNTVVESVVGIRFKGEYLRNDGSTFVPQLRLAWVHILSGEDITIDQTWGGTTNWFTETLDRDYFVADLGLSLYKLNNMDISLSYSGRFSDNSTSHGGWLRLQWEF